SRCFSTTRTDMWSSCVRPPSEPVSSGHSSETSLRSGQIQNKSPRWRISLRTVSCSAEEIRVICRSQSVLRRQIDDETLEVCARVEFFRSVVVARFGGRRQAQEAEGQRRSYSEATVGSPVAQRDRTDRR